MMHMLRSAYGYTDEQILAHIIQYGEAWIREAYQNIVEDEVDSRRWLVYALPVARTAQSRKGGSAIAQYQKRLLRVLDESIPWVKERKAKHIKKRLAEPPRSTKPIVIK